MWAARAWNLKWMMPLDPDMESNSRHIHAQHVGHGIALEMHEVHSEHPNAGMHSGHDRHAGHSVAMFRDKF